MTLIEITAEEAAERKESLKNAGRGKRYNSVGDMLRDMHSGDPAFDNWEEYLKEVMHDSIVLHNARLWEKWSQKARVTKSKPLKKNLWWKANRYGNRHRLRMEVLDSKFEEKYGHD